MQVFFDELFVIGCIVLYVCQNVCDVFVDGFQYCIVLWFLQIMDDFWIEVVEFYVYECVEYGVKCWQVGCVDECQLVSCIDWKYVFV